MTEVVQLAEVLFPIIINDMEENYLLELLNNRLSLALVRFLQVARNVVNTLTISDWNHDTLIHCPLILIHLLDDWPCNRLNTLSLAWESLHCSLETTLWKFRSVTTIELFLSEWTFHCKNLQELFLAAFIVIVLNDIYTTVPNNVRDIHTDTLTHQSMTTLFIDNRTLFIHYVIIFQQTLTDTEVVFFNLLLSTLNTIWNHWTLNTLTIFKAESIHYLSNTLGSEETHQLIFKWYIEYWWTRVTLTTSTTTKLTVYTTALMTLCTNDSQTTSILHFPRKLDICTTTCHIGSNRYSTKTIYCATSLGYNLSLL